MPRRTINDFSIIWLISASATCCLCLLCLVAMFISIFLILLVQIDHYHKTTCYVLNCDVDAKTSCPPSGQAGCTKDYKLKLDLALVLKGTCSQIRRGKVSNDTTLNNLDVHLLSRYFPNATNIQQSKGTFKSIGDGQAPEQVQIVNNGTTYCIHQSRMTHNLAAPSKFCKAHPETTRCYYDDRNKQRVVINHGSPYAGGIAAVVLFGLFTMILYAGSSCCLLSALGSHYDESNLKNIG